MICLLLIMTMIIINGTDSVEQKVRHSDTLLKEEDMSAKTKAWLLMVESGKVDEEELRRITPKSIFIAPLLTGRTAKCKEGYRHDHLGQCVKVIKIDPKVQLELLLQRLNKLYGEKKEEKKENPELFELSSGPLHFSLPISSDNDKLNKENNDTIFKEQHTSNETAPTTKNVSEFIPIPLPMVHTNQTNQINITKEIESSGAEPLNETETYEALPYDGSGDGQVASGDGFLEELTTASSVSILSEETDYDDVIQTESSTVSDTESVTETPIVKFIITNPPAEVFSEQSYQNVSNISSVNESSSIVLPKEKNYTQEKITIKNISNSEKIHFPSDNGNNYEFMTPASSSVQSSRIRFPDEVFESPYHPLPELSSKTNQHQVHPSTVPKEQFWWLPKNWQVDENQQKSALVKIWSRLPLIHDITYSRETPDSVKKSIPPSQPHPNIFNHPHRDDQFSINPHQQHKPSSRVLKPFRNSRFQDIVLIPRQNFKFQR